MAFWIVITPLPLAFVTPRGGARLYILLFGWAMIFAKLAWDVIMLVSKVPGLSGRGVEVDALRSDQSPAGPPIASDRKRKRPLPP